MAIVLTYYSDSNQYSCNDIDSNDSDILLIILQVLPLATFI